MTIGPFISEQLANFCWICYWQMGVLNHVFFWAHGLDPSCQWLICEGQELGLAQRSWMVPGLLSGRGQRQNFNPSTAEFFFVVTKSISWG